jgi:hypothetical protein
MRYSRRIREDNGPEDAFSELMLAARPEVEPLSDGASERILARVLDGYGARTKGPVRWKWAVALAPAAGLVALVAVTRWPYPSPLPHVHAKPLPGVVSAQQPGDVVRRPTVKPPYDRPANVQMSEVHHPGHGRHVLRVASTAVSDHRNALPWPAVIPVEFVDMAAGHDELLAAGDSGVDVPIDVSVTYGADTAGSAETIALDIDDSGAVVENRCAVAASDSREQVVATTTMATETGSLFVSVERSDTPGAAPKEEQQ